MGNWWWARAKIVGGVTMPADDQSCPSHPAPRVITLIVVIVVAIVAAVISYSHMVDVAVKDGEPQWRAILVPIPIDGLMVAAALTCYARQRARLPGSHLAWGALGSAILTSILTNIADARPEPWPIFLAASAPVGLAWAFEMLLMQLRAERYITTDQAEPTSAATTHAPSEILSSTAPQTPLSPSPALTPPTREVPAANPGIATPAPTTQSPRRPAPQSADESTARSPNGQTGRGSTAASSNGSGAPERREPRERPTRAGRTIPEDKQERIYRMLRSNVATHEQIAEDCEVHPRTVANYSRKMRDRQMAAARNGNERRVRR